MYRSCYDHTIVSLRLLEDYEACAEKKSMVPVKKAFIKKEVSEFQ